MDSKLKDEQINENSLLYFIHIILAVVGFLLYIVIYLLFQFYEGAPSLIKKQIFTFILLNSFKSISEIIFTPSLTKELIIYCIGVIEFYLIISYLNDCFTTKKISVNSSNFELEYIYYILFLFIVCYFPYEKTFDLSEKFILLFNIVNIILLIILFRYINIKMGLLFDYLKDKKMTNSAIPDIYLPYIRAHYYYTNFNKINNIFYLSLFLGITYYSIKILDLYLIEYKTIFKYLSFINEECFYCSIIIACIIFFYCLNKKHLNKRGKRRDENGEDVNLANFTVIDVDIQQEEDAKLSGRKKRNKKKEIDNDEDEEEKEKTNNAKGIEETETLK